MTDFDGAWIKAYGSDTTRDTQYAATGYQSSDSGFVLGFDNRDGNASVTGFTLGVSSSDSEADMQDVRHFADVSSLSLGAYYHQQLSDANQASLSASIARSAVDGRRVISLTGLERTAVSSYDSLGVSVRADLNRVFSSTESRDLGAGLSVRGSVVWEDGYTETGAGALNLTVGDKTATSLVVMGTGQISQAVASQTRLNLSAGLGAELASDRDVMNVRFADGTTSVRIEGSEVDAFRGELGVEFVHELSDTATLSVGYEGAFADGFESATGQLKLNWLF